MLLNGNYTNNDFNEYEKTVKNYIETGTIPNNVTKRALLNSIAHLKQTEIASLRQTIEWTLPMDEWAYHGPLLENMPKAAKWATLAGIGGGIAQYQISNNFYSATATGLFTGAVTFFGQQQYKNRQIKSTWNSKEQRANEFLILLPEPNEIVREKPVFC